MPLRETEAIILKTFPLGESDRIVSFLSRGQGRMRGVAPGARRPRSRFGSLLEPLSHVRLWFYERETRPLVRISEGELLESFFDLQKDYQQGLALATIVEIAEATLPEREPNEPSFRLILAVTQAMKRTGATELALVYFLLWTVRLSGWLPSLELCASCGSPLAATAKSVVATSTGLICANCRSEQWRTIPLEEIKVANEMLHTPVGEIIKKHSSRKGVSNLMYYLKDIIEHHIEHPIRTDIRAFAS